MTGIDGAITVRPDDRPHSVDRALTHALASMEAEFFVEWQVPVTGIVTSTKK